MDCIRDLDPDTAHFVIDLVQHSFVFVHLYAWLTYLLPTPQTTLASNLPTYQSLCTYVDSEPNYSVGYAYHRNDQSQLREL